MLEVICLNKEDIINVSKTNVSRIELCDNIKCDGLSFELIKLDEILNLTSIPIRVMLRFTNDFNVHDNLEKYINYINKVKEMNTEFLDGFVLGFLNSDNTLDYEVCDMLIKCAYPFKVTFHKACDILIENNDLDLLKNLYDSNENFDTLLTQGGTLPIIKNISKINLLSRDFNLLLGGGINPGNINELSGYDIHLGRYARIDSKYENDFDHNIINESLSISK